MIWLQSHVRPRKRIKRYFETYRQRTAFDALCPYLNRLYRLSFETFENTNHPSTSENVFYRRISVFFFRLKEKYNKQKKTKKLYILCEPSRCSSVIQISIRLRDTIIYSGISKHNKFCPKASVSRKR